MEDTQVLDADAQREAPLQSPEPIQQDEGSQVLATSTAVKQPGSIAQPQVGEANHASDISTQINRSDYSFKSPQDQSKEPTVTTQSTTKGNVTDRVTWEDHYGMEDTYKADASQDYDWNKIAQHRSQYTYEQEATQVLSDYAKSMNEIKEAASQAMDQYFAAAYGANQTADKMGWQGGQVTSNDSKTAFLKASTAANMYNKFELQKYGVESQLTVARLYAEANMEALALDLYQDAIDVAAREADITGYYIAPEASEIMKQQKVAQDILSNKNSTEAERTRAQQVINAGNAYFDKLGFEKDPETGQYMGIKTLAHLEFLETLRANHENERIQEDANKIAEDAVAATREGIAAQNYWNNKNYELGLRQIEATERQTEVMNRNQAISSYGNYSTYKDSQGNWRQVTNTKNVSGNKVLGEVDGQWYTFDKDGSGALVNPTPSAAPKAPKAGATAKGGITSVITGALTSSGGGGGRHA